MCVDHIEEQKQESALLYFLLVYTIYRFSATEKKKAKLKTGENKSSRNL